MTTVDKIRFMSSGKAFDGAEVKIENPDQTGNGEVGRLLTSCDIM